MRILWGSFFHAVHQGCSTLEVFWVNTGQNGSNNILMIVVPYNFSVHRIFLFLIRQLLWVDLICPNNLVAHFNQPKTLLGLN